MKGDVRMVEKGNAHTRLSACGIPCSCTVLLEGSIKAAVAVHLNVFRFPVDLKFWASF